MGIGLIGICAWFGLGFGACGTSCFLAGGNGSCSLRGAGLC